MKTNIIAQTFKPKALVLAVTTACLPFTAYAQTTSPAAQHFAALDSDGSASLDESELMDFANNYTFSTDELLEQFDTSDSGEIEYGEFTVVMNALAAPGGVAGYQPGYVPVITEPLPGEQNTTPEEANANQPEQTRVQNPDRGESRNATAGAEQQAMPDSDVDGQRASQNTSLSNNQNADQAEAMTANSEAASDRESQAMIAVSDGSEEVQQSPESAADTLREDTASTPAATDEAGLQAAQQASAGSDEVAPTAREVPPDADRVLAEGSSTEPSVLNTPLTELRQAPVVNAMGVAVGEVADIVVDIDGQQAGIIFTDENGEPAFALTDEVSYEGEKLIIDSQGVTTSLYDSTSYDAARFTSVPVDDRTLSQVLRQASVSSR